MAICTLLTDFGTRDYYVAAVKGTLLRLAPGSTLVDISHELEPGDVGTAGFLVAAVLPAFADGTVHLAVVDPGVGSERRILAVEVERQFCVGPDNGLLSPLLGAASVRSVDRTDLFLSGHGQTFQGRDRFAPVAAFLLRGGVPADLGGEVHDAYSPKDAAASRNRGSLEGRVLHVDRFGNLVTNIPSSWLSGRFAGATVGSLRVTRSASYYAELQVGETAVLPGSLGTLEVARRNRNLAAEAGLERGVEVRIELAEGRADAGEYNG